MNEIYSRREGEEDPPQPPDVYPPVPVEDPPDKPTRGPDGPVDEPTPRHPTRV